MRRRLLVFSLALAACSLPAPGVAAGAPLEWRLEQPSPPPLVAGEPARTPVGLGRVGDIEFWAPNRGLLITDGNGETIKPGIWAYDGEGWHELATVCGATDGRIAWAGPDEFWTISDGRPGQAANPQNGEPAPLIDDTLCHFAGGQVVGSYASPAFEATSYQPMHAAACLAADDCWFGGEALPSPQVGAFHLHWNGGSLGAEPGPQGHAVQDMRTFAGHLYESVRLSGKDALSEPESAEHPSVLHEVTSGRQAFVPLHPRQLGGGRLLPHYGFEEFPTALDYLHLSADEEALWAAAGPAHETPAGSEEAAVTVLRLAIDPELEALGGDELVGAESEPTGKTIFKNDVLEGIAADPGTGGAWLALDTPADAGSPSPVAKAIVAHVGAEGSVAVEELPTQKGLGGKGAAHNVVCPASNDCWMVTTQGWLFHLSEGQTLERDGDPAFAGPITFRPPDEGLPQVPPDEPPPDTSGLPGEAPLEFGSYEEKAPPSEVHATVALVSHQRTRMVHRTTLELRFHLAVKARVRLVAKRAGKVVAATRRLTLAAGNRRLLLRLDPRHWPTKLELQQHALVALPTETIKSEEGNGGPQAGHSTGSNSVATPLRPRPRLSGTEPLL